MHGIGSLAAIGTGGVLALVASGWVAPTRAQEVLNSIPLTNGGGYYGAGYAKGYAYFCTGSSSDGLGRVWKVATGNANGPSSNGMEEITELVFEEDGCNDGAVDSRNGLGYWVGLGEPIVVFKTNGNEGDAQMTKVGTGVYTIAESTGDNGASIALDETTNMLYVGGVLSIYKLNAGGPTELPSFVDKLELDTNVVGSLFFGIAIDPAGGYGYAGGAVEPLSIVMFSLGSGSDPMAYVGRIDAAGSVYGMQLNALTGALYAGFYDYAVTAQMWTTSRDGSLPNAVGTFDLGQGEAIYTNKAFIINTQCNILYVISESYDPVTEAPWLNFFDMGDGTALPTFLDAIPVGLYSGLAGTSDEYGYSYFTNDDYTPAPVIKISNPTCTGPALEGGPFTLMGTKSPARRAARAGNSFRVTFALSRSSSGESTSPKGTWEDYDVIITLPGQGATLKGKPRVTPRIPKRKDADVANNALIAWNSVPMQVLPGTKKNYTRKFSFAIKTDKAFIGNLSFAAAATGPQQGWFRSTTFTVPVIGS